MRLIILTSLLLVLGSFYLLENRTDNPMVMCHDPNNALDVASHMNKIISSNDLIIASPAVAWLFHSRVSDFQVSLTAESVATEHLPADIPRDRYAFDPRFNQARFVVIDPIWRNWAASIMPAVAQKMAEV